MVDGQPIERRRTVREVAGLLHPLLLAAYPVLFLYASSIGATTLDRVARALVVCPLAALLLAALFSLLFGDVARGAVLTSVIALLFFSYGHLFEGLRTVLPLNLPPFGWHAVLMPLWFGLLAVAVVAVWRGGEWLARANRYLSVLGVLLVGFSLLQIGVYEGLKRPRLDPAWLDDVTADSIQAQRPDDPPDVYYLILDEYSRDDVLRERYGYDNRAFIAYLEGRGFYVARESRANYPHTVLSLTSSLNLQYLDGLAEGIGPQSGEKAVAFELIGNSVLSQTFQGMGYQYIFFSSGWGVTERNRSADVEVFNPYRLSRFERVLGDTTWLKPVMPLELYNSHRTWVLSTFEDIAGVAEMDEPTFVFAHFVLPHGPYVFRTDEGPLPADGVSVDGVVVDQEAADREAAYLEQVGFANREVAQLIDAILAASDTPPIIVIQADHGKRPLEADWGAQEYDAYVMPILNAYYLPGEAGETLYPSITPVNTWRLILNAYFGTHLDLLEDRGYFAYLDRPYDLVELPGD